MELLTLLSEIFINFLSAGEDDKERGKNRVLSILSILLLIIGIVWVVVEVPFIKQLESPNIFVGVAAAVSFVLAIGLVLLLFRLGVIGPFKRTGLFLIVMALALNLLCLGSFLNRSNAYRFMELKPEETTVLTA